MLDRSIFADKNSRKAPRFRAETVSGSFGIAGSRRLTGELALRSVEEVAAQEISLGEPALRTFEQRSLATVSGVFGVGREDQEQPVPPPVGFEPQTTRSIVP